MSEQPIPESHPVLTINAQGELIGDLSHIPGETIAQLQSPEGRERLREAYRKQFGTDRRKVVESLAREVKPEQRDFRHLCPPGMSNKEFRKLRRKYLREQTKSVLKEMSHGHNANSNPCPVAV